jgi:SRSO17 transposase
MNIFQANVSMINKFLDNFKEPFSNKQFSTFKMFLYAMLPDYKRLNLSALSKNLPINYQQFQYFFADSKWNYEDLNNLRINTLRKGKTTGFSKEGILAIDDTGSVKPYAKKTDGVAYQHCPSLKDEAYCNVAVGSCFAYGNKHLPLNLKFYRPQSEFLLEKEDPDFRSKIDFAKELIEDAISKNIPFSYAVFDSWYPSSDLIEFINEKKRKFIAEIKSDRNLLFRHPVTKKQVWLKQDELVRLIKKHLWHKARIAHYKDAKLPIYGFESKLKDCSVPIKAFVIFGSWSDEDDKDIHILVTNGIEMSYKKVVGLYMQRWGIEQMFRELKDTFYFDHYQVRHQEKIMRYWMLCILAWSLLYWIKQNACLLKTLSDNPSSFNEYKQALTKLILFSSYTCLSKSSLLYEDYFSSIKSKRFRQHCLFH